MKKLIGLYIFAVFAISASAQNELTADQIFDKVNNSVVVINAYDKAGNQYQGSGVVLSTNGLIITNYHVCSDANRIDIKHYSKEYKNAEIYLKDEAKDLLVLKIYSADFTPIHVSSSATLRSGQRIYAVGSPEGYENSISEGIISGFRFDEHGNKLVQMTAPITEGSSGGALLNSRGELIGLSVSGQHEGNLYFAIPSDYIVSLAGSDNVTMAENKEEVNYYDEGTLAKENQNYREAEMYFTKHLEKFSYDVKAYFSRGYSRTKLKEYRKAISDFDKAIEFDPDDAQSYFFRGNCHYSLMEYDESVADYSKAIELDPDYGEFYFNRGYAYYKLKMYNEAVADWDKCIAYNPDYAKELTNKIKSAKEKLNK